MTTTPATDTPPAAWVHTRNPDGDRLASAPQLALPMSVAEPGTIHAYKIALPYAPPSKNVFDNWVWQVKHSVKGKWCRDIARECEAQQLPKRLEKVGLAAVVFFPDARRRDLSNYAQTLWNFVPDALQRCGVLVDDAEGRVQYPPNLGLRFAVDDRKTLPKQRRTRTVITVTCRIPIV